MPAGFVPVYVRLHCSLAQCQYHLDLQLGSIHTSNNTHYAMVWCHTAISNLTIVPVPVLYSSYSYSPTPTLTGDSRVAQKSAAEIFYRYSKDTQNLKPYDDEWNEVMDGMQLCSCVFLPHRYSSRH